MIKIIFTNHLDLLLCSKLWWYTENTLRFIRNVDLCMHTHTCCIMIITVIHKAMKLFIFLPLIKTHLTLSIPEQFQTTCMITTFNQ